MTQRVLCVDDDPYLLEGYRRQLRKSFDVETADSAEQALAKLAAEPFAVLVSDMRMPGMSGLQLLEQVQQRFPEVVRIMLSGDADLQHALRAAGRGRVLCVLAKPCSRDALRAAICAALDEYRQAAQAESMAVTAAEKME